MLVCNVSLRPSRAGIAAGLVEAASAIDTNATGNVVFAALVDDPASVLDRVDAYSGEIMREAASAAATVNAGMAYSTGIVAAVTTLDAISATITTAPTGVTWDSATASSVTLSGGNLVATSTSSTDGGAHVAAASGKTTGKYYFEITNTALGFGGHTGWGIGTPTSTYAGIGNDGTTGVVGKIGGQIWTMGNWTHNLGGSVVTGTVICMAVDLDNRKMWFRSGATGDWNATTIGSSNPATNAGGATIPAGTMVPFVTSNASGNVFTANFGASAFSGAVPSGFTSGWL